MCLYVYVRIDGFLLELCVCDAYVDDVVVFSSDWSEHVGARTFVWSGCR